MFSPSQNKTLPSRRRKLSLSVVFLLVFVFTSTGILGLKIEKTFAKTVSVPGLGTAVYVPDTPSTDPNKPSGISVAPGVTGMWVYKDSGMQSLYGSDNLFYGTDEKWYTNATPNGTAQIIDTSYGRATAGTDTGLIKTSNNSAFDPLTGQNYISQTTYDNGVPSTNWVPSTAQTAAAVQKTDAGTCSATDFTCHMKKFVAWVADGMLWLFSWTVYIGAKLLDLSFFTAASMGFTKSKAVTTGWPIVRDLANMFFSLILLVIAFATILRIESYGMKQVLWRLVVAALLINFSLVIAGVVVDGSNVLTNFFARQQFVTTTGSQANISDAILQGLKLAKFYDTTDANQSALSGGAGDPNAPGFLGIILNMLLGCIFMLVAAFTLFAAAVLFFIRMIVLWILLIFAPLAWLAMVLPGTRNLWNRWWSEFMKWIIFAPVYAFFIYLTVAMLDPNNPNGNIFTASAGYTVATAARDSNGFLVNGFLQNTQLIANYIVLIIFLVAGLVFARSSGIVGASALSNAGIGLRKFGVRVASRWQAGGAKSSFRWQASRKMGHYSRIKKYD